MQQTELQFDLSLLVNQTVLVVASNVQGVDKFHIQLPSVEMCQNSIAAYMAKKDSQVCINFVGHVEKVILIVYFVVYCKENVKM